MGDEVELGHRHSSPVSGILTRCLSVAVAGQLRENHDLGTVAILCR